jgi:zinc D-Ala-D-Ala dipeptidase
MNYSSMSSPTTGLGIVVPAGIAPPLPRSVPRDARVTAGMGAKNEALVDVTDRFVCVGCYHRAGWPGTSERTWLRSGVADRLAVVEAGLPDGFGLAIFDGWRSEETIRALYAHFYGPGSTLEPGYLADPNAGDDPPHLTGGAVDLTLTWDGNPLSLGTPFDEFTPRAHLRALEAAPDDSPDALDRDLRRLLCAAMTDAGLAPYSEEWWHYSVDGYGPTTPVLFP